MINEVLSELSLKPTLGNEKIKEGDPFNDEEFKECFAKLSLAVIFTESGGNKDAISPVTSTDRTPAFGLMQIKDEYAQQIAPLVGLVDEKGKPKYNLLDPKENLKIGIYKLYQLYQTFPHPSLVVAAYNFGQGNLSQAIKSYEKDKIRQSVNLSTVDKKKALDDIEDKFSTWGIDGKGNASRYFTKRDNLSLPLLQEYFMKNKLMSKETVEHEYRYLAAATLLFPEDFK